MRELKIDVGHDRFFHIGVSGMEAEELLQYEQNGVFLIRESTSLPGEYALSIKNDDAVLHSRIYHDGGLFRVVPKDHFINLHQLVEHYIALPMIQQNGDMVRLKQLLFSTRFTAATVDDRIDCLTKIPKKNHLRDGIAEEFERLHHPKGPHLFMSCKAGRRTENLPKNRYRNVVPYDHTRVTLNVPANNPRPELNDYINANYVRVLHESVMYEEFKGINKQYIATQGCLPNTVDDLIRMIWQENSRVIVMTTKDLERGRLKCSRYWPEFGKGEQKFAHNLYMKTTKETDRGEYVIRELELRNDPQEAPDHNEVAEVRTIHQYQFLGWEDCGCPSSALLKYLHEINTCTETKCPPDSGPMVVHCSAGIGRTGTFIVLDIILAKIKAHGPHAPIDVFKTVRMVREQRATMVQTEAQYRFLYDAISNYMKKRCSKSSRGKKFHHRHLMNNGHEKDVQSYLLADED